MNKPCFAHVRKCAPRESCACAPRASLCSLGAAWQQHGACDCVSGDRSGLQRAAVQAAFFHKGAFQRHADLGEAASTLAACAETAAAARGVEVGTADLRKAVQSPKLFATLGAAVAAVAVRATRTLPADHVTVALGVLASMHIPLSLVALGVRLEHVAVPKRHAFAARTVLAVRLLSGLVVGVAALAFSPPRLAQSMRAAAIVICLLAPIGPEVRRRPACCAARALRWACPVLVAVLTVGTVRMFIESQCRIDRHSSGVMQLQENAERHRLPRELAASLSRASLLASLAACSVVAAVAWLSDLVPAFAAAGVVAASSDAVVTACLALLVCGCIAAAFAPRIMAGDERKLVKMTYAGVSADGAVAALQVESAPQAHATRSGAAESSSQSEPSTRAAEPSTSSEPPSDKPQRGIEGGAFASTSVVGVRSWTACSFALSPGRHLHARGRVRARAAPCQAANLRTTWATGVRVSAEAQQRVTSLRCTLWARRQRAAMAQQGTSYARSRQSQLLVL